MKNEHLLRLLSKSFPNKASATGEIVRLKARMAMPKGTEYFFSDIHGEDRAFVHLVRSASGNIRRKIRDVYRSRLSERRQNDLASIIYDPDGALARFSSEVTEDRWVRETVLQLIEVARFISSKYPREDIRNKMPDRYATIMEELFYTNDGEIDRLDYYASIVDIIFNTNAEIDFIRELSLLIQRICVNHIHLVGDIFDRGPGPHRVLEELISFDKCDIQWGNHDVVWMGAALGNETCMMAVLRNALRYNTFDALEDGYSIHLRQLDDFAQEVYGDDPCERFQPRIYDENIYDIVDRNTAAKMHKAVSILEFKLEGQLIKRHPEYGMDDRIVLEKIDYANGTYVEDGVAYPMLDKNFPTIDPKNPLELTKREKELLRGLKASFLHSETLQRHLRFLYTKGSSYLCYNGNLLFHGCVPMTPDGEFESLTIGKKAFSGQALFEEINYLITQALYASPSSRIRQQAVDFMWYLWCGAKSPMFGKSKMATFENYFVNISALRKEHYNPYYKLSNDPAICDKILKEFGLPGEKSHIINGHVPVKLKDGQTAMRAGGKLFVIDGGIAKSYREKTGIAGYTLIFNSHHIALAQHNNAAALENEIETYSPEVHTVDRMAHRVLIGDTDQGAYYKERIEFLEELIKCYNLGIFREGLHKGNA